MRPLIPIFATFFLILFSQPGLAWERACHLPVLRVVDGDTIEVRLNGNKEKVRLLHVDTPESVHPDRSRNTALGKQVSDHVRIKLEGQQVCLEFDRESRGRYGRLLAYVFLDSRNINLELVRDGFSPYYTKYGTSVPYHPLFLAAQAQARQRGVGIWSPAGQGQSAPARTAALPSGPFVGNTRTRVFHRPGCQHYQCALCTRTFVTPRQALGEGFRPCGICRP